MIKKINSELIIELAKGIKNQNGFSKNITKFKFGIEEVSIGIISSDVAKKLDRDIGNYVCLNFKENITFNNFAKEFLTNKLCKSIKDLIKKDDIKANSCLVVGLGNEKFACDSLGKNVSEKILVTPPYIAKGFYSENMLNKIYSISTGVYGSTGLDSSEVIKSVCNFLKPDLVIVVDSLVAGDIKNLCTSIQLSDTRLIPGGGVGNSRTEISAAKIGVPVFAIGVPLVVRGSNFCNNSKYSDLIVTPKDVEVKVDFFGKVIAMAINLSLNNISKRELEQLTE